MDTAPVLHTALPTAPWLDPSLWRLPGTKPLDPALWLMQDEAFAGQMALRDRLIAERPSDVLALLDDARPAARECLDLILDALSGASGYVVSETSVMRPDGTDVPLDRDFPMRTIGRLVQEDVCLLVKSDGGEHVLAGAALCFPASWTLAEKIGRPLSRVHAPVAEYDTPVAQRVQRMFDMMRPETPLWRANALLYLKPELFQPRPHASGSRHLSRDGRYLRSERQTLRKLPETGAVVFTIHTYVVPVTALGPEAASALGLVKDKYDET